MNLPVGSRDIASILDEQLADAKMRILQSLPKDPAQVDKAAAHASETPADMARRILECRRVRARHFPPEMLHELGWEILLHLFVASQENATISGAALTGAIGGAASSINRWTRFLEHAGLIRRRPCYDDRRVLLLELTSDGEHALFAYLTEITTVPS